MDDPSQVKLICPVCRQEITLDCPYEGMTGTCLGCNTHLEVTCEEFHSHFLCYDLIPTKP